MTRIRSLPHLLVFDAAARHESFSRAAAELCLTTGAVSRHIKNLEDKLGEALFFRSHKKITLTARGRIFALSCRKILNELAAAETDVMENSAIHHLTINSLPSFAMHWLIPRLPDFHRFCPHVQVNVITSTGKVPPGTDLAVRRDPVHFPGMEAIPFLKENSALVCNPAYLQKDTGQGEETTFIHIRVRDDLLPKWSAAGLALPESITQHLYLDHTFAAIQAAEDNLGIALVPLIFCEKHMAGGRLLRLDRYGTLETGTYHLVLQKHENSAVQEFIDWLMKGMASDS